MTAISRTLRAVRAASLAPTDRVGVACSGGRDSVVLLAAAAEALGSRGIPVRAVHVHHGLRGADSDADAALVKRTARRLGVPCSVLRAPVAPGPGLEARARTARYAAFERAARTHRLTALLLAHHADDQAETVLMRLLRGAGARGLRGMPAARPLASGCQVLRPLLSLRRADLEEAADESGLEWHDDQTNTDRRFLRNRIRHEVLPALHRGHERALRVARRAHAAWEALESTRRLVAEDIVRVRTPVLAALDAGALRSLPDPLAFHVVEHAAPVALTGMAWATLLPVLAGGPAATLEGPVDAVLGEDDTLWMATRGAPALPRRLSAPGSVTVPALGWELVARGSAETALVVRPWRAGDRLGGRTIASILRGLGVPAVVRKHYPIVCDRRGPVWVPSKEQSRAFAHGGAKLQLWSEGERPS